MIDIILGYIKGLRLSTTEGLYIAGAAIVAVIVAAFKIQGSALHRAQVQLLMQNVASKESRAAETTDLSRDKYLAARTAFLKAGGTLLLLVCLLLPSPSPAQNSPDLLPRCEEAVRTCNTLVDDQDSQIKGLNQDVKDLEGRLGQDEGTSILPKYWWVYTLIGGVIGVGSYKTLGGH